jgi:hypothetical protein
MNEYNTNIKHCRDFMCYSAKTDIQFKKDIPYQNIYEWKIFVKRQLRHFSAISSWEQLIDVNFLLVVFLQW